MKPNARRQQLIRYAECVAGLFITALGVALTKRAELGISPISSVPNVLSFRFTSLTLGMWMVIWNSLLIVGQIVLLRKEFKPYQLLQLPVSFLFGAFLDFGMWCVTPIPVERYGVRLLLVLAGVVIVGFGTALSVLSDVIMNSGDALAKTIAGKAKKNFGAVKVCFDVSCVVLSILLSLVFFRGRIVGTREGTVITALLTGHAVRLFSRLLTRRSIRNAVSGGQPANS
ncbi:MAG: DUF6198 family protein [Clostridiales bacterium]|nr:DUF6198 family protein [Clostridiales bacterium]